MTGGATAGDAPGIADRCRSAWQLRPEGRVRNDDDALELPVRTDGGEPATLRISRPGNDHEHLALRWWGGRGAVRLLRAEPADRALLLERTEETDLGALPDLESCRVLGELVRDLARPPRPPFPRLSDAARRWQQELEDDAGLDAFFPRRFRQQAVKNLARLRRDELDAVLVHGRLHHGAVRAARRAPWLVTGADPVLGTPEFALAPALEHRAEEAGHGGSLAGVLADRIEALALAADADPERLRAWALVRWTVAARRQASGAADLRDAGTSLLVRMCKAVQKGA